MPFLKEIVACLLKLLKLRRCHVQMLPIAVELSYYSLSESSFPGRNQTNIRLEQLSPTIDMQRSLPGDVHLLSFHSGESRAVALLSLISYLCKLLLLHLEHKTQRFQS